MRMNGNGLENTVDYYSWAVNEIHQNCSQWTWSVVTVYDCLTILSGLYHKISLVHIKTCILAEFSWISCVCSLVFEWDLVREMRLNEINMINEIEWSFTPNLVQSLDSIFCWMNRNGIFLLNGMSLTGNSIFSTPVLFIWTGWDKSKT
jgi:hypothetical protein